MTTHLSSSKGKAVLISNLPSEVSNAHQLSSFLTEKLPVEVVECSIQTSVRYARVVLSSVDQAKTVLSLNGTAWLGFVLKIQPWTLNFQPNEKILNAKSLPPNSEPSPYSPSSERNEDAVKPDMTFSGGDTMTGETSNHGSARSITKLPPPPSRHRFHVQQTECAIFIRKIPLSVTTDELKIFIEKRIQLAFRELADDNIAIISCNIISKGDGSLNQACMEFSHPRIAEYALQLRTKTIHGQPLDILAWEDRSSQNGNKNPVSSTTLGDQSSVSSDECSGGRHSISDLKQNSSKQSFAVHVRNLPEDTSAEKLSKFLIEMFLVAYKDPPTIIRCSVRCKPHNDAYVQFATQEQVNRAIYLRNRTLGGRKIVVVSWDHTFKTNDSPITNSTSVEPVIESRDDNGIERLLSKTTSPVSATKTTDQVRIDNQSQSHGNKVASFLSKSFFETDDRPNHLPLVPIPSTDQGNCTRNEVGTNRIPNSSLLATNSSINVSNTLDADVATLKRQLDTARLENQGLKRRIQESAQSIVRIEQLKIDRNEWKVACLDCRSKLDEALAELESCRDSKDVLANKVEELQVQLDDTTSSNDSSKKRKSNELAPIQDDRAAMVELQGQLSDTERRFKVVTESLTDTVQENRKLRTMLEKEQGLRIEAERQLSGIRSSRHCGMKK